MERDVKTFLTAVRRYASLALPASMFAKVGERDE